MKSDSMKRLLWSGRLKGISSFRILDKGSDSVLVVLMVQ